MIFTPPVGFDACMNWFPPIYIPTWPIPEPDAPLNSTKSPACKFDFSTAVPTPACALAECAKLTP